MGLLPRILPHKDRGGDVIRICTGRTRDGDNHQAIAYGGNICPLCKGDNMTYYNPIGRIAWADFWAAILCVVAAFGWIFFIIGVIIWVASMIGI